MRPKEAQSDIVIVEGLGERKQLFEIIEADYLWQNRKSSKQKPYEHRFYPVDGEFEMSAVASEGLLAILERVHKGELAGRHQDHIRKLQQMATDKLDSYYKTKQELVLATGVAQP